MAIRANGISAYSFDGVTMRWDFADGIPPVEYKPTDFNGDPFHDAALHNGFKQSIGDAGAISDATPREKRDAMAERVELFETRTWTSTRAGTGVDSLLFAVLKHYYGGKVTDDTIRGFVKNAKPAERKKMLYSDRVKKSREHVERERAKLISVNVDEMFEKLENA